MNVILTTYINLISTAQFGYKQNNKNCNNLGLRKILR